ncbi:unnamed protein product [marine sediment metagenome]|uniref:Uncharacterized protein n=1 Tax=marine sediment metagenome TaxID=412755 RepID=X0TW46_9ZZZZ
MVREHSRETESGVVLVKSHLRNLAPKEKVSRKTAKLVQEIIGAEAYDEEQFWKGMNVEQEHWEITKGDPVVTGKIAMHHLSEVPDYYDKLEIVEGKLDS